jgi:flagellar hook-length control protein FliK
MAAAPEGPARTPQPAPSPAAALLGQASGTARNAGPQPNTPESGTGAGAPSQFSGLLHQAAPTGDAAPASGARAPTRRPSASQTTPVSAAAPVLNATLAQVLGSCAAPATGASTVGEPAAAADSGAAPVASATDAPSVTDAAGAAAMHALPMPTGWPVIALPAGAVGDAGQSVPGAATSAKTATAEPGGSPASAADEAVPALALMAPLAARAEVTAPTAVSPLHANATDSIASSTALTTSASSALPDAASAGALLAHGLGSHAANDASPPSAPLSAPLGSTAWAEELGGRLILMAHGNIDSASLRMSPADLGPIEVRIDMRGSDASVWFGATHADTRAALEQSLPRLRELFAGQGLSLSDSGVFREPPHQQPSLAAPARTATGTAVAPPSVTPVTAHRVGLIDLYA